jgi:2-C-methyl-D-erythritol 4-phosphate cytidylyltransferase
VAALLAASGSGQRLGLGPKAFVRVGGLTLLELCLQALHGQVDEVVVAVPAADVDRTQELAPSATIIAGGVTRQETVRLMLRASRNPVVLVHDVARPFLTPQVIAELLAAVLAGGAATAALQPADTVVRARDGDVVPREQLRLIQTPQGFRRQLLSQAHDAAARDGYVATDDATLVRRLGHQVTLVQGSPLLAKLTTAADLPLFAALHTAWLQELRGGAPEPQSADVGI